MSRRIPQGAGLVVDRAALAREISARTPGLSGRGATPIVDIVVGEIAAGLRKAGDVTVPSMGRFQVRKRAARRGTNPYTREPLLIPAREVVAFKASKFFEGRVFDDEN